MLTVMLHADDAIYYQASLMHTIKVRFKHEEWPRNGEMCQPTASTAAADLRVQQQLRYDELIIMTPSLWI